MTIHYLTPDPRMLLRSDGVLVASDPGIEAREPEEDELEPVLMAAAGFGIDALAELMTRRGTEDVLAARSQVTLTDKVKTIFEKIPEAGDFFEFGFAILSLVGLSAAAAGAGRRQPAARLLQTHGRSDLCQLVSDAPRDAGRRPGACCGGARDYA